jgi:hypothetical protein
MEEWKSIKGYEGLYEVSNLGEVRNSKTLHIKKLCRTYRGYYEAHLYKNHHRCHYLIHRLVATAFIYTDDSTLEVHHKDSIKEHNYVDNLEWVTRQENVDEYIKTVTEIEKNKLIIEKAKNEKIKIDNNLEQIY